MANPVVDISIKNPDTLDLVNNQIHSVTEDAFGTPYMALERVRKVLSYFHIHLPACRFLERDEGNTVFDIQQFGVQDGIDDKAKPVITPESGLFLYFEYRQDDDGLYTIFSEIVDEDDLNDLLDDYENGVEGEEEGPELYIDHSGEPNMDETDLSEDIDVNVPQTLMKIRTKFAKWSDLENEKDRKNEMASGRDLKIEQLSVGRQSNRELDESDIGNYGRGRYSIHTLSKDEKGKDIPNSWRQSSMKSVSVKVIKKAMDYRNKAEKQNFTHKIYDAKDKKYLDEDSDKKDRENEMASGRNLQKVSRKLLLRYMDKAEKQYDRKKKPNLKEQNLQEATRGPVTDKFFDHPSTFTSAKQKVTINHTQATKAGSVKTLEGDRTYEPGAHIMGPGPKGEHWPISTHEKFSALYDDNGDGTATSKQIPKKVRMADHDGEIQSKYGSLKYEKGKHYIVRHGTGDYGVVEKDIFSKTYEPKGVLKEQNLQELSTNVLKSYVRKSRANYNDHYNTAANNLKQGKVKMDYTSPMSKDDIKKQNDRAWPAARQMRNRQDGQERAIDKLFDRGAITDARQIKEAVNLQELSKEVLKSYRAKADESLKKAMKTGDKETVKKRLKGLKVATKKYFS